MQSGVIRAQEGHQEEQPVRAFQEQLALAGLLATKLQGSAEVLERRLVAALEEGDRRLQSLLRDPGRVLAPCDTTPDILQSAREQVVVKQHAPDGAEAFSVLLRPVMGDERRKIGTGHAGLEEGGELGFKQGELDRHAPAREPLGRERDPGEEQRQQMRGTARSKLLVVELTVRDEACLVVSVDRQPDKTA